MVNQMSEGGEIYLSNMQIIYKKVQSTYKLIKYSTYHQHQIKKNFQHLKKFMEELPSGITTAFAKTICMNKFPITQAQFYYYQKKIFYQKRSIIHIINQYQDLGYKIFYYPFPLKQRIPDYIIFISPQMKQMFRRFGERQYTAFDLTYNLIKERNCEGKQYSVGFFTGMDYSHKIIPFGFLITCCETTSCFTSIFQTFFTENGSPKAFITDEQKQIKQAINRLKETEIYDGNHVYDCFHILRNLKRKIKKNKDLFSLYVQAIKEPSKKKFLAIIQNIQNLSKTQDQIVAVERFLSKVQNCCFSQLPVDAFVPFIATNSFSQKINDLFKEIIQVQKPYAEVLIKLCSFCEDLIHKSKIKRTFLPLSNIQIFKDSKLYQCRIYLSKKAMTQFIYQYLNSLKLKVDSFTSDSIVVEDDEKEEFIVRKFDNLWVCTCLYQERTGIPCSHIFRVLYFRKESYLKQVHERWIQKKEDFQIKKQKRGRPRNSRRNK